MLQTHAVGIDLGTTYSCIAHLNEHGEPVTIPNQEGELLTPSVVMFDGAEVVVGTEALRNAITRPEHVIQNSKRFIGDPYRHWLVDNRRYTPVDIAAFVLKKLITAAEERVGSISQAVITVPAQFSDLQRQATTEAGYRAGLKRVDIINEPVAAALCYVLGSAGMWFSELADAQRILVYDLGGGTFDLSLVNYERNEVSVLASSGDLKLGGIDWNNALETAISRQFLKDFQVDPRADAESRQALYNEVEQAKRSLTVRPRTSLVCQHAGHRKTYQVEQHRFERLTKPLLERTIDITMRMLRENKLGWAHVDVVLTTGGASRMPMIRSRLKQLSGRTLNTSLSPDQSIAHGATYYAGMLLTNSDFARSILSKEAARRLSTLKQRSVNARGLGFLVRAADRDIRIPHYIIPANTQLPASATQTYGTVVPNQRRVSLTVVESGFDADQPPIALGSCVIDDLPPNLPEGSQIAVTLKYDAEARVHVSAVDVSSGKQASTVLHRDENLVTRSDFVPNDLKEIAGEAASESKPEPAPRRVKPKQPVSQVSAEIPVPLCHECGEPLAADGTCPGCRAKPPAAKKAPTKTPTAPARQSVGNRPPSNKPTKPQKSSDDAEEEFWKFVE
ncbi:MAG: Hsp70 family protein [Planctomycetaceae bacterium]